DADGFALLSRAVLFGILGEAYLWRILSIARGATRWTDARNAAPFAGFVIALAVLLPLPADHVDRGAFAPLALIVVAAAGLALSLARTTEELALSRGTTGSARASSATSATVVLGAVAIVAAALMPGVQDLLGAVGNFISPIVGRILYLLILPFAYLAGALVEWLRPLLANRPFLPRPVFTPMPPDQEEELLRQIEQTRPFLFGFVELVVAAIAVLIALVLLDRMLRERRLELPEGVTLERERTAGMSLMDALRGLRPRARVRRRPPVDDGTPVAAIVAPTASGKSALALDIAETHDGEIVSADSRQVYRGLSIGTAKPTAQERARVPHHLIDVADAVERYDVSRYQREARAALADIARRGRLAVVVGGTGLYVRALLDGLDLDAVPTDPDLRASLEAEAA